MEVDAVDNQGRFLLLLVCFRPRRHSRSGAIRFFLLNLLELLLLLLLLVFQPVEEFAAPRPARPILPADVLALNFGDGVAPFGGRLWLACR